MAWQYIPGRWWIFAIPIVVFVLVGSGLIIFDIIGDPSPQMKPGFLNSFTTLGVFFILSPLVALLMISRMVRKRQKRETLLIENGMKGIATIISVNETGLTTNNVPQLEMELEVSAAGRESYRTIHRDHISLIHLHRLVPGAEFPVFVSRDDPDDLLFIIDHPSGLNPLMQKK
jgi:hypothetical protein